MAKLITLLPLLLSLFPPSLSTTFTLSNNCGYTVWPGCLSNSGSSPLASTGFPLSPGQSLTLDAPTPWSGRFFARTLCSTDASNRFSCLTADCGSGTVECSGGGAAPPATLAEFTLASNQGMDFYDVSLVDGYNVPMLVTTQGGTGNCAATGCTVDLNGACPAELRVVAGGGVAACKSACEAFGSPEFCCSGAYGTPAACRPSEYSAYFKNACPKSYSYAYDDATSTFTCSGANYFISFCPSTTSLKSSGGHPQAMGLPSTTTNETMLITGGAEASAGRMRAHPWLLVCFASLVVLSSLL